SNTTSSGLFFNYENSNIIAALDALTAQGRVRTLSSPRLLAIEDQESSVIVGDRRGYSVVTTINLVTSESIEFLESGVILRVTPSVDAAGKVLMDIHPEVSTGVIDPVTGIPSQSTTEVSTRMIVPDGQTIFVGGLIKHRIEESRQGVPIISRIPGVGRLFSSRSNNISNTETIVLITPTILDTENAKIDEEHIDIIEQMEQRQDLDKEVLNDDMELSFGAT
ncbi:MAG: type II and III secretion system protein, partial [Woeseiaceae bacterium]|nr:type II and III secretion system protein [Woeseiaceae bacterium]